MEQAVAKSTLPTEAETFRVAVIETSAGQWAQAMASWEGVLAAGRFPHFALLMIAEIALRSGDLDRYVQHEDMVGRLLAGTELHAKLAARAVLLYERRIAVTFPDDFRTLSLPEIRGLGRTAVHCHLWAYGAAIWTTFLEQGGVEREAYKRLGMCYAGLGDHANAIVYFGESVRLGDDESVLRLDREKRLAARLRQGFSKHAERLSEHVVTMATIEGLPALSARDPDLGSAVTAELQDLSSALGLAGGAAAQRSGAAVIAGFTAANAVASARRAAIDALQSPTPQIKINAALHADRSTASSNSAFGAAASAAPPSAHHAAPLQPRPGRAIFQTAALATLPTAARFHADEAADLSLEERMFFAGDDEEIFEQDNDVFAHDLELLGLSYPRATAALPDDVFAHDLELLGLSYPRATAAWPDDIFAHDLELLGLSRPRATAALPDTPPPASEFICGHVPRTTLDKLPFFAARGMSDVLADIALPQPPAELLARLEAVGFDAVMFVANTVLVDPRVMRTAAAVTSFGHNVLTVGLQGNPDEAQFEFSMLPDGGSLLLLPNLNRAIVAAMRQRKLPTADKAPRMELGLLCAALQVASLMDLLASGPSMVLHTHDFHGTLVGGAALGLVADRSRWRWIHDVHEYIRKYDIIDQDLQAAGTAWEEHFIRRMDHISTVSEELSHALQANYQLPKAPTVIYNCNTLASRNKYRGPTAREKLGLVGRKLLVHSGNVTQGRGLEHVIRALPQVPEAHLLLITQSDNGYVDDLVTLARSLGVHDRVVTHPYLPADEVMGFVADADVGLIPMDRYGNADVALPNKLFDYILSNTPILSSDGDAMKRFLTEWPVGELFAAGNVDSLAQGLRKLLANPDGYRRSNKLRPDRILSVTWEAQMVKLFTLYSA